MPNSLRIDDIQVRSDGSILFNVKEGDAPLDAALSADGIGFSSRRDFVEQMRAWVDSLGAREKLFILVAAAVKNDPQLGPTTLSGLRTKQIIVDFTSPSKVIAT